MSLTEELRTCCIQIMEDLMEHPCSIVFSKTITPEENPDQDSQQNNIPAIKHPVDLSMIKENLIEYKYKYLIQWESDMKCVWVNPLKANKKDFFTFALAKELKTQFRKLHKRVKLRTLSKWTREASKLKDKIDALLDSPPEQCSQYVILSQKEDFVDCTKEFNEREKTCFGKATFLVPGMQDQKKILSMLNKYKTPLIKENGIINVDLNDLSNQEMYEIRAYIEKRLVELHIPYPR
ncbi:hypothetical protein TVAG_006270 [Trichomonas vaginalis G3]|uniref:Bromo domain-containing protein n=1 Tax=Trichomonas vaginalis (strain ATCC PRA-98 / G3) TaxID=412133 RepID=A2E734_TRIV3|nr:acetylation-dependent protein binding [Trichomonas vaginalis G3]EAY11552.1 hypothetical protein TVAG_006270 [Trichomonas vaginalis G3]KAI5489436.1 acetylation-dependent protein binding [Trichomonas vaginalis G3]|eukprot:XP_001323775.1 hypothetical protein [Trichomonas vaginalis G3]